MFGHGSLPGIDQQPADQRKSGRDGGGCSGSAAEESAKFAFRDEIAHPGVPGATGNGGHPLVQGNGCDERDDARRRPKKWRSGGGNQQRPANPRGPGCDGTPPAQAFNQRNRGQLQELHGKWHRRQQADRGIAGTEFYRVTGKEHAGCERGHGFAGERVVENQSERPVGSIRRTHCRRIAIGHFRDFAAHVSSRQLHGRSAQAAATGRGRRKTTGAAIWLNLTRPG